MYISDLTKTVYEVRKPEGNNNPITGSGIPGYDGILVFKCQQAAEKA